MVIQQQLSRLKTTASATVTHAQYLACSSILCLLMLVSTLVWASSAKPITTVVISCEEHLAPDHDDYYFSKLLDLVLTKTIETYGPYQIKFVPVMPITNRLLREIELGRVDLTWMPHNANAPKQLIPIKFPLLKDLSDHRVFLIRAGDQARFSRVKTMDDLRQFRGGIGSHWPDRIVMEENGLPLVLSMSYFNLFKMLASNRFDYYSRGIHQVLPEVNQYSSKGIALESDLLLRYENPVYFYLNKSNAQLFERISVGLKMAQEDGSFDTLFGQFENFAWAEAVIQRADRRVIWLTNFSASESAEQ